MPVLLTLRLAAAPNPTTALTGCAVITGGVGVGAKFAVYVMFEATVTVCGLFVALSLQPTNTQPLEAVAVITALLPTTKVPLPVTVPPTFVLLLTVSVAATPKFAVYVMFVAGTVMVSVRFVVPSLQLVNR